MCKPTKQQECKRGDGTTFDSVLRSLHIKVYIHVCKCGDASLHPRVHIHANNANTQSN